MYINTLNEVLPAGILDFRHGVLVAYLLLHVVLRLLTITGFKCGSAL
jgi:hypothetical protein